MIQEFSLNNFLSFGDKQTVSFLASSDKAHIKELTFEPKKGVKILRFLMVYGANASGKSNLLAAIWNLWEMLIYPTSNESEKIRFYKPFELKKGAPVAFEIVFWKEHTKFEYIIKFNESEILYEKMQYTTAAGILSDLYERVQGEEIKFGSTLQMKVKEKNDFNIETLKNHTVLSTLNKKNIKAPTIILELYHWIKNNVLSTDIYKNTLEIAELARNDEKIKAFLIEILGKADFNITDIDVVETKVDDNLIEEIQKNDTISEAIKVKLLQTRKQVFFTHKSNDSTFQISLGMESSGTKAYFRLARLLLKLKSGNTIILEDELEDSLHYDLLLHFLETYIRIENNNQLIFTTHNQMLLDESWLVRRDMICLIEKSQKSSFSQIYKVSDLGLHKNISILNAYRIGKLGGKPNLGTTFLNDN